jgi:protein SCO1/2
LLIKTERPSLKKDYEGKIYVADFFLPVCGAICPKMTANLFEVQKAIIDNPKVMLLSHTVFRSRQCPVLKEYAVKYGVNDKMEFGNQTKKEIYTMARKSYLAVKLKN